MFFVRRVAARALSQQPSRQLCTVQPRTPRVTILRPVLDRSFHQSRLWLAEEDGKRQEASPTEAETTGETVTNREEPSAADEHIKEQREDAQSQVIDAQPTSTAADAVSESAGSTAEDAAPALNTSSYDANAMPSATSEGQVGGSPESAREPAQQQQDNESLTDKAADFASSAAQTAQSVASSAGQQARQAYDNTAQRLQHPSSEFPSRTPAPAAASSQRNPATTPYGRPAAPPSKILYIGNLFFEVTAPMLETEFSRFGDVTNSRVVTDSRGLSKGFAYVEFADQESADKAVRELDQKVFQGRRMAVQYHVRRDSQGAQRRGGARQPNPSSKTLFIGNMSYQMSDRDLNDLFREIRNVLDVRVAIDRRSGQPRGFAHADFIDIPSAERAKEHLEAKVIYGRQLKVDFSSSSTSTRQEES